MSQTRIFKPSVYPLIDREFDGIDRGLICSVVHAKRCAFVA